MEQNHTQTDRQTDRRTWQHGDQLGSEGRVVKKKVWKNNIINMAGNECDECLKYKMLRSLARYWHHKVATRLLFVDT